VAGDKNISLPAELGDALVLFHRIEKELKTDEPACLCHNDLLAGNFIDDGHTMHLIDWEYGGRGDRFLRPRQLRRQLAIDRGRRKNLSRRLFRRSAGRAPAPA